MTFDHALPLIFMALMGLAMLAYVILDGFDLGVGLLLPLGNSAEKDRMIAAIGPFWDANETWLVLGVGLLLIAFPKAHGVVMGALYLPVAIMLIGLTLRGVAFDFRVKAHDDHQALWNKVFFAGSVLASAAQGWMLGRYVTGFADGLSMQVFAAVIALVLPAAYLMLGATWLLLKTEGLLQARARTWAWRAWPIFVLGMGLISMATPWVSATVRERWFAMPQLIALLPIPLTSFGLLVALRIALSRPGIVGRWCALPFVLIVAILLLGFFGLAYSIYPYVVMDRITLWQAASAPESLRAIFWGTAITVPAIIGYTIFAYRVFWGKATDLRYA